MRIRPEIAALIRDGHTDASIARRLHCRRSTVFYTRKALQLPNAQGLARMYAEGFPDGTYGDGRRPWTPAEQLAHRMDLEAELSTWSWQKSPLNPDNTRTAA